MTLKSLKWRDSGHRVLLSAGNTTADLSVVLFDLMTSTKYFVLPDGSRYRAKTTKRGEHLHGVAVKLTFPDRDGNPVDHWTLSSQHQTVKAAVAASKRMLKSTPHLSRWQFVMAKPVELPSFV